MRVYCGFLEFDFFPPLSFVFSYNTCAINAMGQKLVSNSFYLHHSLMKRNGISDETIGGLRPAGLHSDLLNKFNEGLKNLGFFYIPSVKSILTLVKNLYNIVRRKGKPPVIQSCVCYIYTNNS
jgi:hypothetical protein